MRTVGDCPNKPSVYHSPEVPTSNLVILNYELIFTTSGAVSSSSHGSPDVSVTKTDGQTGQYDFVYPAAKQGYYQLSMKAAGAGDAANGTSFSPTAGTLKVTVETETDGTSAAADGTSGDSVFLTLFLYF
jgi:hypothetical protein